MENMTSSKLFEGIDLKGYTPKQIRDSKVLYNYIAESIDIAKETGQNLDDVIDEGLLGAIAGGVIGATVGKSIMEAVCRGLGIAPGGILYNTLTSRMVLAAVGAQLGESW